MRDNLVIVTVHTEQKIPVVITTFVIPVTQGQRGRVCIRERRDVLDQD